MDTRCNGYANFETNTVAVHMSNTKHITLCWEERAKDVLEAVNGDHMEARYILAAEMKELADEGNPLEIMMGQKDNFYLYNMYSTLLLGAIESVNWLEIADIFIER